jgi:hypothetical protein
MRELFVSLSEYIAEKSETFSPDFSDVPYWENFFEATFAEFLSFATPKKA